MAESQVTEVQVFSGGVRLVPASHLLSDNESRQLSGIDLRKGILAPFLAPLFEEEASGDYVFHYRNEFYYYDLFRSNVLYNRNWYWTSVFDSGKVYPDGTQAPLGIGQPVTPPIAVIQNAVNGLEGNINYVYTYYDPKSGSESPPSTPSNTLDFIDVDAGKEAVVSGLAESPDGYLTRLYRIGGIITAYSAVVTLPLGTTEFTDKLSFTEIEGMILDTFRAYEPPVGLQYLTVSRGRFYGAVGAELYYTPVGKPDSWYALDFIAVDDVITGVVAVANGVIIMSENRTWLLSGTTPQQFSLHLLSDSVGCISVRSIAVDDGTAIWLSNSGYLMSNGASIVNLSVDKLGSLQTVEPFGSVYTNKRYLMSFGGTLYPSDELVPSENLHPSDIITEAGVGLSQGAVVIDFTTQPPAFSTIADVLMGYIMEADDEVYQVSTDGTSTGELLMEDDNLFVTEEGAFNFTAVTQSGISLSKSFKGSNLREVSYVSKVYTDGSIGSLKQYEKVRISYSGIGVIEARDEDGRLFATQDLASVNRESIWMYIPVTFNRGFGIQFSIVGVITVDSIQWTWTPREAQ